MVDTTHSLSSAAVEGRRSLANLSMAELVEQALRQGNARLASNGALNAETVPRTGRSPRDKLIVQDADTSARVAWGGPNQPIAPDVAGRLQERIARYLREQETFVVDAWAGADPAHRLGVRVVDEYAWHALFARQLFLRTSVDERAGFQPLPTPLGRTGHFGCDRFYSLAL